MPLLHNVTDSHEKIQKKSRIKVLILWAVTCKIQKFVPVNICEENQNASVYVLRPTPEFKKLCTARTRYENLILASLVTKEYLVRR